MFRTLLLVMLFIPSFTFADDRSEKKTDYVKITKLASSYEFNDPGLYEIKSKETGYLIYLYIDRAGNVEISSTAEND